MNLEDLLTLYRRDERTQQIIDKIGTTPPARLHLKGVVGSVDTFISAALFKNFGFNHLIIMRDKEEAAYFHNDLDNILGKKDILFFPDSYKRPGQLEEINKNNVLLRLETITHLKNSTTKGEFIVTYPEALFEKVMSTETMDEDILTFQIGSKVDIDSVIDSLVKHNFERTDFVFEPGNFSLRGGIIDIFSFGNDQPYRIELFGDEVESIRAFDPLNQLSLKKIQQVSIIPNLQTDNTSGKKVPLLEIIGLNTIVWSKDMQLTLDVLQKCFERAQSIYELMQGMDDIEDDRILFSEKPEGSFQPSEIFLSTLEKYAIIETGNRSYFDSSDTIEYDITPQTSFNKNFDLLIENYHQNQKDGITNILFADNPKQIERFYSIFEDLEAKVQFFPFPMAINKGFVDKHLKVACYTDHQIFERYHKYQMKRGYSRDKALLMKSLKELRPGDYITHIDHGIGQFSGLEKIEVDGQSQEMVRLVYKNNDLLYVSINSLYKIAKYVGKETIPPKVNRLGSNTWENLKQRAKRKIKDIAKDLIKLYAKRKDQQGYTFSPDSYLQFELEASFIYEDTPDQVKATQAVKKHMESSYPMDMLVCGDVGFGKTEIAIRASTKAVADNKQVAMLVPTTILALQHYNTFKERLKDFPCRVDYLNRFKTTTQKKETLKLAAEGAIDIIIGTHVLLGKNFKLKDLGLLIIDEEQKFGVAAKEKLKHLKVNVDTLTLTATPIPRTLQFSLMGARDLSVINTAPPNRQAIQTELHLEDEELIREALYYEANRGGQVFYIHNKVKDIDHVADMVRNLCPDLTVKVAHGQMEGKALEESMRQFIRGDFDILISTNIVESGLDIPNVNTIIINNAHHFGLSDLHQLRGRVGRSNRQAFCYLITPPVSTLSSDARKRLQTIEEYADLGSGFNIALRDLDIRGAGNLLGGEQSGFIAEIGFEMYQKILDEAIQELKEKDLNDLPGKQPQNDSLPDEFIKNCQFDTDIEILIPDDYVSNIQERLHLYTQLNLIKDEEEIAEFQTQLSDRFGPIPKQVKELINAVRLQWVAKQCGFQSVILKNERLQCFFIDNQESPFYHSQTFTKTLRYIQQNGDQCHLKQTAKSLILTFKNVSSSKMAKDMLDEMSLEILKTEKDSA